MTIKKLLLDNEDNCGDREIVAVLTDRSLQTHFLKCYNKNGYYNHFFTIFIFSFWTFYELLYLVRKWYSLNISISLYVLWSRYCTHTIIVDKIVFNHGIEKKCYCSCPTITVVEASKNISAEVMWVNFLHWAHDYICITVTSVIITILSLFTICFFSISSIEHLLKSVISYTS